MFPFSWEAFSAHEVCETLTGPIPSCSEMLSIPQLLLLLGVPVVREKMPESLEEGQLETLSVCACLIKNGEEK